MEKLTKKDLKSPDAFISNMHRFSEWAFRHRMTILSVLGVIAAAAVIWAGVGTYHAQREEKGQEALFAAEKKIKTVEESFQPKEIPAVDEEGKKGPGKTLPPTATKTGVLETDYKDSIPALKEVIANYGDTQASVIAALDLGRLYYDYKKYDEEIETLKPAAGRSNHPVTKAMVLDNLGLAFEAKGDCQNAATSWTEIQNDKSMAAFHGTAMIKAALCYEKLGQTDKAIATYQRIDDAEKEMKKLQESMATEYHINPNLPPQLQPQKDMDKFQQALLGSPKYRELENILSDRQAVRAAKKYLKLVKKGPTS